MLVPTGSGIEFKAGAACGESTSLPGDANDVVDAESPGFSLMLAALNQPVTLAAASGGSAVDALAARMAGDGLPGRTLPLEGELLPLSELSPALAQGDDDDGLLRHAGMLATAARLGGHAGGDPLALIVTQQLLRKEHSNAELALPGLAGPSVRTATATALLSPGQGGPALSPQQPGFDQTLAQRVLVFVQQGIQDARVRVHPEHLGPIEIRIRLEADALQVTMASPHAAVREALESALPRLREALAEQGLDLGHAEVGSGERDAERQRSDPARDAVAAQDAGTDTDEVDSSVRPAHSSHGYALIDTFA